MKNTTKQNLLAIFGTAVAGQDRTAKMLRKEKRAVPIKLSVPFSQATDLWVWTATPRRVTQNVIARIDLSSADAKEKLAQLGIAL
jgi:hypothetical protein